MIKYIVGDVIGNITNNNDVGIKIIPHVCNCNNGWGKGFVLVLNQKWQKPQDKYRRLFKNLPKENWSDLLGLTQFVTVEDRVIVANMIAQKGYGKNNLQKHRTTQEDTEIPLQYWALEKCLLTVKQKAKTLEAVTIHAPMFGAGLAGGKWEKIEEMIIKIFSNEIEVFVYKF